MNAQRHGEPSEFVREFDEPGGTRWTAAVVQTGGMSARQIPPPAVINVLVLHPLGTTTPRYEIPIGPEVWHVKKLSEQDLLAYLSEARASNS